ncbi:hypothetical protein ECENVIRA811_4491 [Escherichia coli Envira 8/11]|nr:hypothetical protein ECENVIRA811_4491 [Escherichia coli Envira 8/11]
MLFTISSTVILHENENLSLSAFRCIVSCQLKQHINRFFL